MVAQLAQARGSQSGPFTGVSKSASITPGAIANAVAVDVDFPMADAAVGDVATVSFNLALVAGILFAGASIVTAGHVTLRFSNITAAPVTQTAIVANVNLQKPLG